MPRDRGPAVAVAAQSGSLAAHVVGSLTERGVPVAYSMTTGNEADLELADFIGFYAQQPMVGAVAVYAEQIRRPGRFLAAVAAARAAGKPVVVLHPGRSDASRAAAQSHTGALSGDHALISAILADAGVMVAHALEELIDLTELLRLAPEPSEAGLVSISASGAVGVLVQDYAEERGLPLAELSESTRSALAERFPGYLTVRNPLDLGTSIAVDDKVVPSAMRAAVDEPEAGSLLLSLPYLNQASMRAVMDGFITETTTRGRRIPAIFNVAEEGRPLWPDVIELAHRNGVVMSRSPERSLRALARLRDHAVASRRRRRQIEPAAVPLGLPSGPLAEWRAKNLLRSNGVPVPDGDLASSVEEAADIADRLGYPVAVKAQSAALTHKSDLGAVALGLGDAGAVRRAYQRVRAAAAARRPGLELDGVLVERMAEPAWNSSSARAAIRTGARSCSSGAALLTGARGADPVDIAAVAGIAAAVGALVITRPEIREIDLNPVIAGRRGAAVADALIIAAPGDADEPASWKED